MVDVERTFQENGRRVRHLDGSEIVRTLFIAFGFKD